MISISEKLHLIAQALNLTQTELASRLGVSFVTLNTWWNGKSEPREKKIFIINELFLKVTGQQSVPEKLLISKKGLLFKKSTVYKNIFQSIFANPDIRDEFILKLTYHSNSIEGSTMTEADTSAVIFDHANLPNRSLIEQMEAKNHQAALNRVFEVIFANEKLDEAFVLNLHAILLNGIQSDAGRYRQHGVRIVGANLPTANYLKIPELVPIILRKAARRVNDIIGLVATVHAEFERIHPFSDGNGRVGRLLMTAMLLKANLPPAIIKQEEKRLYYAYLNQAQTGDDQSQLEDFMCEAVMDGFAILERK